MPHHHHPFKPVSSAILDILSGPTNIDLEARPEVQAAGCHSRRDSPDIPQKQLASTPKPIPTHLEKRTLLSCAVMGLGAAASSVATSKDGRGKGLVGRTDSSINRCTDNAAQRFRVPGTDALAWPDYRTFQLMWLIGGGKMPIILYIVLIDAILKPRVAMLASCQHSHHAELSLTTYSCLQLPRLGWPRRAFALDIGH